MNKKNTTKSFQRINDLFHSVNKHMIGGKQIGGDQVIYQPVYQQPTQTGSQPISQPVSQPEKVTLVRQIIETIVKTIIFSLSMQMIEYTFTSINRFNGMVVNMFPLAYDSPQTYKQDPNSNYEILQPSRDERNGTEFSYSSFISVQPETFTGEVNSFKHVFHKGSANVFPLMAPGVFFKADTNTLRVYMNSSLRWNNFVDIPNIPMKKWFHLVVMVKGKVFEVYINGNLASQYKLEDVPKLNYGDFYLLLPRSLNLDHLPKKDKCTPEVKEVKLEEVSILDGGTEKKLTPGQKIAQDMIDLSHIPLPISGRMNGLVSKVKYFAFALSYSQIDKLLREGPSSTIFKPGSATPLSMLPQMSIGWDTSTIFGKQLKVQNPTMIDKNLPGYQADGWWTSDFHNSLSP